MRENLELRNIKWGFQCMIKGFIKTQYELQLMNMLKIDNSSLFLFQAASCFQCGRNTLLMMWNMVWYQVYAVMPWKVYCKDL